MLVPIEVVDGQVLHAGGPLRIETLPPPVAVDLLRKGTRSTSAAGVALRTKMGASPFGAGFVEAVLPPYVGGSSAHDAPAGKTGAAKLPLAVHNTWAVFHDPTGDPATARLLVLRGFDLDANGSEALLADARRAIPRTAAVALHRARRGLGRPRFGIGRRRAGGSAPSGDPAAGSFGLSVRHRRGTPATGQPNASNQPADPAAEPTRVTCRTRSAPPDWSSQSFGMFGLGTPTPPDDPAGERKAP